NANWQLSDRPDGDGLPLIRGLSMPQARATLHDARRHLSFEGSVSVQNLTDRSGAPWLQILGKGQLNEAAVEFQTISDPLASASRRQPYHFSFAERSPSSQLSGRGALAHAFDFDHLETRFEASGDNLHDLYALAGVSLINTGTYRLSGTMQRRDALTDFRDLNATSGGSDLRGSVSVDASDERPKLSADLHSNVLRLVDLGEGAARHESVSQHPSALLLSDAALKPDVVRHGEAIVRFQLQRLEATRLSLQQIAGTLSIDHGILTLSPLNAQLLDGHLSGRWQLNATGDTALDTLDLHFSRLQIGQLDHPARGAPRYEALLNAQLNLAAHGSSLHQIGASANGHIATQLLSGTLRESLAELSGVDLRGLGLALTRSQQQTTIRCGAAHFEAHDGTLTTDDLLIDTDEVRISGQGTVQLDSEALHLELRGHPKQPRLLRLKAPVQISGTLLHPHVGLEQPKSLQLIDRGSDRVVDCQALLAP
ncbi:MAG TPA: AsmA family protein, partial [Steroidobacteraceae bacterium]|nr:AsmA family protein [Steroidobacteraceae bacterium]